MFRFLQGKWRGGGCCFLLLLAFMLFRAPVARAQVGCGGEGQSTCTVADSEFYSNNNYAGCQYDLQANGSTLSNLVGNSSCVNQQRYSLTNSMTLQMNWDAWALAEQRHGIGRYTPLNWITTMGSHNSYSSSHQGYTISLGQNQIYSITDQLNAGARILELDPKTFYQAFNGGHLTVCHGSPFPVPDEPLITVDASTACIATSAQYAREFQAVLGEIASWMKANPNEVLVLFIDVGGSDNYISGHEQDLQNDVVNVLGSSVWTVADTVSTGGHVPSIDLMQQRGRSVILIANTNLQINGVHTFDTAGNLYGVVQGAFPSNSSDSKSSSLASNTCIDGDEHLATARGQDAWFRLAEGRSGSDWDTAGARQQLINEGDVQAATGCTASYVELDFLYARDQVPTSGYEQSGPDLRFDSGVWSWQQNDYGLQGPAVREGGRWVSSPTLDATSNPVQHQAACVFLADQPGGRQRWALTNNPVTFAGAAAQCPMDHPGYVFGYPVNGYENVQLTGDNIWLNYKSGNLGDPYASPTTVLFQYPQGTIPITQTFQIIGQPNKTVTLAPELSTATAQYMFNGQASTTVTLNAAGSATVSVTMFGPQALNPGLYPELVRMAYADGTGRASSLSFIAIVQLIPEITLNPPSITIVAEGTPWTPTVTLNLDPANNSSIGGLVVSGTLNLVDNLIDTHGQPYVSPLLSTNFTQPALDIAIVNTFPAPLVLPPGTHNVTAEFVPGSQDGLHSRVASNTVVMNINPELTFNPAQITFSATVGGSAPPQSVTVTGSRVGVNLEPFTASWLSGVALGQRVTLSLTAAAAALTPGSYTVTVGIKDVQTNITDPLTVTLNIQGTLVSSVNSVALAARGGLVEDTVGVTAAGNGSLPITVTGPDWLTWSTTSATTPASIVFTANTGTNPPGTHLTGTILIKSPNASNSLTIPADFYVVQPTEISGTGLPNPAVTFDGTQLRLPVSLALVPGSQHTLDASQPVLAPGAANQRWAFSSWSNGSPAVFTFTALTNTKATYQVTYSEQDLLSVTVSPSTGGSVSFNPTSPDGFYNRNTPVTMTANPSAGFTFAGYSGGITSSTAVATINVNSPKTVTATFTANPSSVTISLTTNAAGVAILVNGATFILPAQVPMTPGQTYTLAAAPQYSPASGVRWNFLSLNNTSVALQSYVAPQQNASVNAAYTEQFQVSALSNPPAGGSVSGSGWYNAGASVPVQATAAAGYTFAAFSGVQDSASNPFSIQVNSPATVTGNFSVAGGPSLYATTAGQRTDVPNFPGLRSVPLQIVNRTGGGVGDVQITAVDNIQVISGSGVVQSQNLFPFQAGDLSANGSYIFNLLMNWPATAARVSFTVHFIGNGGSYLGSTTVSVNR